MSRWLILLVVLAALCTARVTAAGVPSPANSTVPACMALCPLGDMPFAVVVRDLANNPIAGSNVVLDFSTCPGAHLCPEGFSPPFPYTVDLVTRTLRMTSGVDGSVTFPAHVGGVGAAGSVRVFADGVLLKSYALASPDQNGNGVAVNIVDVDETLFNAKLGSSDPTADMDCDGDVDEFDQAIFGRHLSHSCLGFVDPARKSSWGSLKLHYR